MNSKSLGRIKKKVASCFPLAYKAILRLLYPKTYKAATEGIGLTSVQKAQNYSSLETIFSSSYIMFGEAFTTDRTTHFQFKFYEGKNVSFKELKLGIFQNALLIGHNVVGVSAKGEPIEDMLFQRKELLLKSEPSKIEGFKDLKEDLFIDEGISLMNIYVNNYSVNYFHWLLETLPSLLYIKDLTSVKVIVNKNLKPFQKESLQKLGVPEQNILPWEYKYVKVSRLLVPEFYRQKQRVDSVFHPLVLQKLRNRLAPKIPINGFNKIYISRKYADGRKVINEDEFLKILKEYGFKILHLEKICFSEQVEIFSAAKFVMGIHGAGLSNILFSKDATIIELIGNMEKEDEYWYSLYYILSQSLNLKYAYLECKHLPYRKKEAKQAYDLIVDVKKLKVLLTKILNS